MPGCQPTLSLLPRSNANTPAGTAQRQRDTLVLTRTQNTQALFVDFEQCKPTTDCFLRPMKRVHCSQVSAGNQTGWPKLM